MSASSARMVAGLIGVAIAAALRPTRADAHAAGPPNAPDADALVAPAPDNPAWTRETRDAVRALAQRMDLDAPVLEEIAVAAIDAAIRGEPRTLHAVAERRGCVLNPEQAQTLRRRLRSAPPEHQIPNLDAMSDEEIFAITEGSRRPMVGYTPGSAVVTFVGALDLRRSPHAHLFAGDITGTRLRYTNPGGGIAQPSMLRPPAAMRDDSAVPCAVLEFLGTCPDGEPTYVGIMFGYYLGYGWTPVAGAGEGPSKYLPPK